MRTAIELAIAVWQAASFSAAHSKQGRRAGWPASTATSLPVPALGSAQADGGFGGGRRSPTDGDRGSIDSSVSICDPARRMADRLAELETIPRDPPIHRAAAAGVDHLPDNVRWEVGRGRRVSSGAGENPRLRRTPGQRWRRLLGVMLSEARPRTASIAAARRVASSRSRPPPFPSAAVGSRQGGHGRFAATCGGGPPDLGVRWLLNVAYGMTLGRLCQKLIRCNRSGRG